LFASQERYLKSGAEFFLNRSGFLLKKLLKDGLGDVKMVLVGFSLSSLEVNFRGRAIGDVSVDSRTRNLHC
jgi:hypothetical protein